MSDKSPDVFDTRGRRFHRRECLRVGLGGIAALSLADLFRFRAQASAAEARAATNKKALIIVWLPGGASHLETYDPKPDAGSEFAGPFRPTSTAVSGMQISELLPHHARVTDRFTILRSLVHTGFCHQQGTHQLLTGHPVRELKLKPDHPDCLSISSYYRHDGTRDIPNYVGVPPINYSGSAYLGPSYEPLPFMGT